MMPEGNGYSPAYYTVLTVFYVVKYEMIIGRLFTDHEMISIIAVLHSEIHRSLHQCRAL